MKTLSTAGLIALLLTLGAVWYLQPLNPGAISVLFLIFLGVAGLLISALKGVFSSKEKPESNSKPWKLIFVFLLVGVGIGVISILTIPMFMSLSKQAPVPARDFLVRGTPVDRDFGAYGVLLFSKLPNSFERQRYIEVCSAYLESIEPVSEYPKHTKSKLMVTYWLLAVKPDIKLINECSYLVDHYDYARATELASSASLLSATDIMLVAWKSPYESAAEETDSILVVKLTNFENEDLHRAFSIWKSRITTRPEVWNDGIQLVFAIEAFRSLIQKYGEDIVKVVKSAT